MDSSTPEILIRYWNPLKMQLLQALEIRITK